MSDVVCACGRKMHRMDNPYVMLANLWVCRSCGLIDCMDSSHPTTWVDFETGNLKHMEDREESMRVRGGHYHRFLGKGNGHAH